MGGRTGNIILPLAIGIGAGMLAGPAATWLGEAAGGSLGGAGFGSGLMDWGASTGAFSWGSALAIGGATYQAMAPIPELPDYGDQFANQQSLLDQSQSFSRRSLPELENLLERGSEFEKNQAFDELRRRGEDETRLRDIATRQGRTSEDQSRIDEFISANAPPSEDEVRALALALGNERISGFDEDVEKERTRLKQISARRGTLDSSRNDQLNLELASIAARNRSDIRNEALGTSTKFQSDIQNIGNVGLNRILQGANFNQEQQRFDLGFNEAERRFQESLRGSRNADQRDQAFKAFQSDLDRQLAVFTQRSKDASASNALSLGLIESIGTAETGSGFRNLFS